MSSKTSKFHTLSPNFHEMGPRSSKRPSSNGGGNPYTPYSAITVDARFPIPVIAVRVHHPPGTSSRSHCVHFPVPVVTIRVYLPLPWQTVYSFRCTIFFYRSDKNCRVSILFSLISQKLMKISIPNFKITLRDIFATT